MAPLATLQQLEAAWRPLTDVERDRAGYWIDAASRDIRRRWRDIDDRIIAGGDLDQADVAHIVIQMVLAVLPGLENPGAKSWSVAAGAESKAITLDSGTGAAGALLVIQDWMVELIDGPATSAPLPQISAPRPRNLNGIFEWDEEYE